VKSSPLDDERLDLAHIGGWFLRWREKRIYIKMITSSQKVNAQNRSASMLRKAGIVIRDYEISEIEVVDFGLSHLEVEGVQVFTMVDTGRVASKVLVLFPNQTEPQHWHPRVGDDPGKQETIRHIWGDLRFYVDGDDDMREGFIVEGKEDFYSLRHEIVLQPGDQLTFEPLEKHWFQAGPRGAVLYSISTTVKDGLDGFSDPAIQRLTFVQEDE
jgi:D-lyxose ketol-isomerase